MTVEGKVQRALNSFALVTINSKSVQGTLTIKDGILGKLKVDDIISIDVQSLQTIRGRPYPQE